jgi:hypothetical protein
MRAMMAIIVPSSKERTAGTALSAPKPSLPPCCGMAVEDGLQVLLLMMMMLLG